jgi:hypothetical protein
MVLDLELAEAQPILDLFRGDEAVAGDPTSTTGAGSGSTSGSSTAGGSTPVDPSGEGSTTSSSGPAAGVALADPAAVTVDVFNSAGVDGLAVEVADRMVALGFDVDDWGNGDDSGHPDEATTVVRYSPADVIVDGENGIDVEAQAHTVAAWVASGATVEVDPELEPGTVAIYLGADFTELVEPTASAGDPGVETTAAAESTSTTGTTTTSTTVAPAPPPSSEVFGMVPLGDPPSNRECG